MRTLSLVLLACLASPLTGQTPNVPVDVELVLTIDVSGSIDDAEYALQMDGYGAAFRSSAVQSAIAGNPLGVIAVNVIFFGENAVAWDPGWQVVDGPAAAETLAVLLETASRPFQGSTSLARGINLAAASFVANGIDGAHQVIDVSGDGVDNVDGEAAVRAARDNATGVGVDAVNALVIGDQALVDYFAGNAVSANGAVRQVSAFGGFEQAVEAKIAFEVGNPTGPVVPEARAYGVAGAVLLVGLILWRRRR